jgi:Spy/CpxP family protein refolding chaperone
MSSKLKPWLVLAIIFIVGVVTGSALTIGLSPYFIHPPGEMSMKRHWMAELVHRLNLTADQQAKIEPIVADASTKLQSVHRDEMERGAQIFKEAHDQISALLTPEQKVELQKLESEREKMFSGHMRPRGPTHEGPDGMHHHDGPESDNSMAPPPPPPPAPEAQTNAAPPGPPPQNP